MKTTTNSFQNESKSPPVSCFSKQRKKYHKSLSRESSRGWSNVYFRQYEFCVSAVFLNCKICCLAGQKCKIVVEEMDEDEKEEDENSVECTTNAFRPMDEGQGQHVEEYAFWERMRQIVLGTGVNRGLEGPDLASKLRDLRNTCLLSMLALNALWLVLLSVLYFNADLNLARLNIYGLIAACVFGLVLVVQWLGMTIHRTQAVFTRFARLVFGVNRPVWIYPRAND